MHLVLDNKLQHYKPTMSRFTLLQRMTNNVRLTFSVGDTTRALLHLEVNKTNRIDDTKYNS